MSAKRLVYLSLVLMWFLVGVLQVDAKPPAEHGFFKLLVGKWKVEGELKGADGKVQRYAAEWTGAAREDGAFVLEGTREIGEETTQSYRWTFNEGAGEGLFEATHEIMNDTGNAQRFEVSSSEAVMGLEMSAFLGSGSAKVTLKETFLDEEHKKLQTEVVFTDDQGNVTLQATLLNEKQDAP